MVFTFIIIGAKVLILFGNHLLKQEIFHELYKIVHEWIKTPPFLTKRGYPKG